MNHNQNIGKWGEDIAAEHLTQHNYEIIKRNVRTPYGEIDIVARQGDITIFVEVKTCTSSKKPFANMASMRASTLAYNSARGRINPIVIK